LHTAELTGVFVKEILEETMSRYMFRQCCTIGRHITCMHAIGILAVGVLH